ncbi:MAG: AAA family ATPase [Sphingobacteriales bacterium]|nr:MAG: AAA family ATPase [Sphingobacteriales bacterium]
MKLELAQRKQAKIKMGLQGPSGAGKTMSALLLAFGLTNDYRKIAVIDTENYSASLYAHLGAFSVLNLTAPYEPEAYIQAIQLCVDAGMECIIIDSVSHEWEGQGGILDIHSKMAGNSFTNWGKLTPRHNQFIQFLLQAPVHVIATIRSKQEYVLAEKNGRNVPEKVGMKGVTRDGLDYEFTLVFDIDIKHYAVATKDRTGLFMDQPERRLCSEVGQQIYQWCQEGVPADDLSQRINDCKSLRELLTLYDLFPREREQHMGHFKERKLELQEQQQQNSLHIQN